MNRSNLSVNCSIIFTELPLLERPRAAAEAGFAAVEFWWPFAVAKPDREETDAFIQAVDAAGVSLTGLNFFAGDMSAGDRGILSSTSRQKEFEQNVEEVRYIAEKTGCRVFNALYGNRLSTETPEAQDDTALTRLAQLAVFTDETGSVIVLEPLSAMETYPLITARQAMDVIEALRATGATTNVKLLADLYHLAVNGDEVSNVISAYADEIGHVQIADAPGRNEPGTGELPILRWFDELERVGYAGLFGLEYRPSVSSADCFEWISVAR
jgi:hydroxypyruvate isomerase